MKLNILLGLIRFTWGFLSLKEIIFIYFISLFIHPHPPEQQPPGPFLSQYCCIGINFLCV